MRALAISLPLVFAAAPALAQDHSAHDHSAPAQPAEPEEDHAAHAAGPVPVDPHAGHTSAPAPQQADPHAGHAGMDHGAMDRSQMDHSAMDHGAMDHSKMDHGAMDHSQMDHAAMNHGPAADTPIPQGPPPPEAFEGPLFAGDAVLGDDLRIARDMLMREVSGMPVYWLQADRLEYRAHQGEDGFLWDVQGYWGGDIDKLWLKSEGEGAFGEGVEHAEVQALWSHAIGPWFDLQAGIRQDLTGPSDTHLVIGVQGVAPYFIELDAAAFLSTDGDLTARIEAELDQRITRRLILQARGELALAAQDIPELGIGAGIDHVAAGLRLRYEIVREFAPYIGVEQEWAVGGSADYARAAGEDPSVTSFVAGVRFWF